MSRFLSRLSPALVLPLLILTGCGATTSFHNPTPTAGIKGKIFGGQQPIQDSFVEIWFAGTTGYGSDAEPSAYDLTSEDGTFEFGPGSYTCPTPDTQVYIIARGGSAVSGYANPNIMLATGLGSCSSAQTATVEINEVTTVATAFALAHFFTPTLGVYTGDWATTSFDSFGTAPADLTAFTNSNQYLIPTLIDIPSGLVQPNTPAITIEAAKIYSIANTLAACVNDAADFANCNTLFAATTPPTPGAVAPADTLQAAVQMALYPYQNVETLYHLASKTSPFTGLPTAPNDWTIGVSYTSADYALSIVPTAYSATSASIDIDASGKIWFPTNLSGHTGVAAFDPTTAGFHGPYLPGAYVQPQYVAIDSNGYVWATDLGSPLIGYTDTADPDGPNTNGSSFADGILGPIASDSTGDTLFSYIEPALSPVLVAIDPSFKPGAYGTFDAPPTGLVATGDYVFASISGLSTPCSVEKSDNTSTTTLFASTDSICRSGGVAFASGGQDTISMATSLNQFCFESAQACGGPPPPPSQPLSIFLKA